MAISIGQRDEHVEGIARQRKEIVRSWAFAAERGHGVSLSVFGIAINGIVQPSSGPSACT
jgi:hypothetical protein